MMFVSVMHGMPRTVGALMEGGAMTQRRENHPGRNHQSVAPTQSRRTKKQFFRIQGERSTLWIGNPRDWKRAHKTGLHLVCPDSGCTQRLVAMQKKHGTRYLANHRDSSGCNHYVPVGGGGRMTDEHLWLQGALREVCRELGYNAELEVDYAEARVDLRVGSSPPFAFEVQRVSTDFGRRRKARQKNGMQTLWLLPESDRQKDTGKGKKRRDPLFSEPSVRLGYRDGPGNNAKVLSVDELRSTVWQGDGSAEVHLRAGVTVGKLSDDHLSFSSSWLPLNTFLQQVLEGDRQWLSQRVIQGKNGGAWAGWLLTEDISKYRAAVRAMRDKRRCREEAERQAAAEAEAHKTAQQEQIAREQQEAVEQERRAQERQAEIERAADEEERVKIGRRAEVTAEALPFGDPVTLEQHEAKAAGRDPWWRRLWRAIFG